MQKVLLFCSFAALVCGQKDDIARAREDVFTQSPRNVWEFLSSEQPDRNLESIGAFDRCGEGKDKGVHACVPYYNCDPSTYTIIETRAGTKISINLRFGTTDCTHYLEVCCAFPTTTVPPNETTQTSADPKETELTSSIPLGDKRCGIRNSAGIDFKLIENQNDEAEFGEFPWMVAILRTKNVLAKNESFGGSLITPKVVLTGAHCVQKFKTGDIKVRAGEWDTQTTMERLPYQERAVAKIIIHEQFHPQTLYNDVALLILEESFVEAENVGTICMPPQSLKFDSRNCFAMGWGEGVSEKARHVILKKIQMPIVQHDKCQKALRSTRLGQLFDLHSSFICAGGEPKRDTCKGDGGSPLVCPDPRNPSRYLQAGIVAWGIKCGIPDVPGVYADVAQYRDWIDAAMKQQNLDTKPYIE